jgi:hypothetical protein
MNTEESVSGCSDFAYFELYRLINSIFNDRSLSEVEKVARAEESYCIYASISCKHEKLSEDDYNRLLGQIKADEHHSAKAERFLKELIKSDHRDSASAC